MKITIQQAIAALTSVYSLKKLKKVTGREGHGFTSDLYKNGVKIGEAIDYAHGCGIEVQIDNHERPDLEAHAVEFCKLMGNEPSKYSETEWFLGDLKFHQETCNSAKRSSKSTQAIKLEFDTNLERNGFVYCKVNKPYSPSINEYIEKQGFYAFYNQAPAATPKASVLPVQSKAPAKAKAAPKAAPKAPAKTAAGTVVKTAKHGDYIIAQLDTKSITVTTSDGKAVSAMAVLKKVASEIGLEYSATTNTRSLGNRILNLLLNK